MNEAHRQNVIPSAWFAVALAQQWVLWMLLPGPAVFGVAQNWIGLALFLGGALFLLDASRRQALSACELHRWMDCPANLAMLGCLVGSALWFGTLVGILPIAGFISVMSSQFVVGDEQALLARAHRGTARR